MDVNSLLDQAKEACGVSYDKDLAPRLGVRPSAISNYRKGVSHPDAVVCATLAGLTGVPLARVLGVIGEARAISREEKAVWQKLAATAMALCLAVGFALPHKAQAAVTGFDNAHVVYIMRKSGFCDFIGGPPPVRHCVSQRLQPLAVLAPTGKQKAGQRWRHHRHPDPHLARVQPRQQRRIHAPYPRGFPPPPVHRQATIPEPESCGR